MQEYRVQWTNGYGNQNVLRFDKLEHAETWFSTLKPENFPEIFVRDINPWRLFK